jgi:transposase-like protein
MSTSQQVNSLTSKPMNTSFLRDYELLDIVAVDVLDELPSDDPRCPYCNARNPRLINKRTTLLGGGTGIDDDPNHVHYRYECRSCSDEFYRETKRGNVWYADLQSRVLRGIPSCYESYRYPCKSCRGEITRRYTSLDGESETCVLSVSADGKKNYLVYYSCNTCDTSIQVDKDYWYGRPVFGPNLTRNQMMSRINGRGLLASKEGE